MQRNIGACSWILGPSGDQQIAESWQAAGLNGVEYNPVRNANNAAITKNIFSDHGLEVFSLTPPDADISSPDIKIRNNAIDTYYWLIDFACSVGSPVVSCHGQVGRITPIVSQEEENANLIEAVAVITERARISGINISYEVLNRYETHQIRNVSEALELIDTINQPNLSILLDSYHMNIEEPDPVAAITQAGTNLGLFHMADSNREAPGHGHIDLASQIQALDQINYQGPIIMEINAPGPNPFSPDKGMGFREKVISQLTASVTFLSNHPKEQVA